MPTVQAEHELIDNAVARIARHTDTWRMLEEAAEHATDEGDADGARVWGHLAGDAWQAKCDAEADLAEIEDGIIPPLEPCPIHGDGCPAWPSTDYGPVLNVIVGPRNAGRDFYAAGRA